MNVTVDTPTFSVTPGTYTSSKTVTIRTTTPGVSINYTTDGSTPTDTVGILYNGPITISASTTLKAIAYATGMTDRGLQPASITSWRHPAPPA